MSTSSCSIDLSIPEFLKFTAEERAEAWRRSPPRTKSTTVFIRKEIEITPEIRLLIEEKKRREENRAAARRGQDRGTRPIPGSHWDQNRGKWVHPVIQKQQEEREGKHTFLKITCEGNPRAAGTKAALRFDEMRRYVQKNSGATLADVMRNTSYTKIDYEWDFKRGFIS